MTKADLVDVIADGADLSKTKAEEVLNLALDAIKVSVAKGNTIQLVGFGSFSLGSRAARMGRNQKPARLSRLQHPRPSNFQLASHLRMQLINASSDKSRLD